jgi:hypothetical protein
MIKTSWGMEFQTTLHAIMAGKDVDLLTLTTFRPACSLDQTNATFKFLERHQPTVAIIPFLTGGMTTIAGTFAATMVGEEHAGLLRNRSS